MSIATIYHVLQAVLVLSLLNFIIGIIKPSIAFKFLKFVKEPNRTKATITNIALIVAIGILGNLPIFAPIAAQDKAEQEQQKAEQDAQEAQAKPEQDVQANTTAADNESKKKADAEAEKLRQASVDREKQDSQSATSKTVAILNWDVNNFADCQVAMSVFNAWVKRNHPEDADKVGADVTALNDLLKIKLDNGQVKLSSYSNLIDSKFALNPPLDMLMASQCSSKIKEILKSN